MPLLYVLLRLRVHLRLSAIKVHIRLGYLGVKNLNPIVFKINFKNSKKKKKNTHECINLLIKRPARDACLCMGELQAPAAPAAPYFVFLITL